MASKNVQTQSGNRIIVEFDGNKIGLLQSLRANDSYGLEDAAGVGDIHVIEHVPTKAVHALSFSQMILFTDQMRTLGLIPENGDAVLQGLVFDVAYYSKDTGQQVRKYTGCSYDSGDTDVSANRIVIRNGQLKALDVSGTGL